MTKAEIAILNKYRLAATPLTRDITDTMRALTVRGLLSMRAEGRHMVRVQTTAAGIKAMDEKR